MAQYKITTEQQLTFDYTFNDYIERSSSIFTAIPWIDAETTYGTKFYVPVRPQRPRVGKTFSEEAQREIQYEELTANTVAIWMDLEIPDVDRRILSRTGMNVESSWANSLGRTITSAPLVNATSAICLVSVETSISSMCPH